MTWDGSERRKHGSVESSLDALHEKVDTIKESLEEISETVYGNGDVKHGLVYKVQQHQDDRSSLIKFGWIFLTGIALALSVPLLQAVAKLAGHS